MRSESEKYRGRARGGERGALARRWPVLFWVRGDDKTGAHGNRELMREDEGEREGDGGTETWNG